MFKFEMELEGFGINDDSVLRGLVAASQAASARRRRPVVRFGR